MIQRGYVHKKCLCASAVILAGKWSYCEINVKLMCMWLLLKLSCLPYQWVIGSISFWKLKLQKWCLITIIFIALIYVSIVKLRPRFTRVSDDGSLVWSVKYHLNIFSSFYQTSCSDCEFSPVTTQRALPLYKTVETLHSALRRLLWV